jgi:hypothetical protein
VALFIAVDKYLVHVAQVVWLIAIEMCCSLKGFWKERLFWICACAFGEYSGPKVDFERSLAWTKYL